LSEFKPNFYDLLLVDINMPNLNDDLCHNRINLDERRRKMLDDSKEKNHVSGDKQDNR